MENHRADAGSGKHVHAEPQVDRENPQQMRVSKVRIDQPHDRCLTKASGVINGWFAIHDEIIPEEFEFRVGPILLPHKVLKRPDVEGAMPDHTIVGFQIWFDLSNYLLYIQDGRLVIEVKMWEYDPFRLQFTIKESALAACIAAAS
jgi:hypothetical protein